MSIETGAVWLSHLTRVGVNCWVLEDNNAILGYLEAYPGDEPDPFGIHLHLGQLVISPDAPRTIADQLMTHLMQVAAGYGRVTASCSSYDTEKAQFYRSYGFAPLMEIHQYRIIAQAGQGFYKSNSHEDSAAHQMAGWMMPVGRTQATRQQWETVWSGLWDAVPELTQQKNHQIRFNTSGQDAFVCLQQQLYDPRSADVYCWSPKTMSKQLLIAIGDWAYKQGYRTLIMNVDDKVAKVLGDDAEADPNHQQIFMRDV